MLPISVRAPAQRSKSNHLLTKSSAAAQKVKKTYLRPLVPAHDPVGNKTEPGWQCGEYWSAKTNAVVESISCPCEHFEDLGLQSRYERGEKWSEQLVPLFNVEFLQL